MPLGSFEDDEDDEGDEDDEEEEEDEDGASVDEGSATLSGFEPILRASMSRNTTAPPKLPKREKAFPPPSQVS